MNAHRKTDCYKMNIHLKKLNGYNITDGLYVSFNKSSTYMYIVLSLKRIISVLSVKSFKPFYM